MGKLIDILTRNRTNREDLDTQWHREKAERETAEKALLLNLVTPSVTRELNRLFGPGFTAENLVFDTTFGGEINHTGSKIFVVVKVHPKRKPDKSISFFVKVKGKDNSLRPEELRVTEGIWVCPEDFTKTRVYPVFDYITPAGSASDRISNHWNR